MLNLRTNYEKIREHRVQDRMVRRAASLFRRRLTREFERLSREVASDISHYEPIVTRHESRLEIMLRGCYREVFNMFGSRVLARIKPLNGKSQEEHELECKAEIDDGYEEAVSMFVRRWGARKATQISNTSRVKIQRVITKGTTEGLDERAMGRLIMERVGGSMGARRARTIARTEAHSASQDAAFELVQASGIDVTKEWIAVEDERTREDHLEVNGTELPMHEHFKVGDSEMLYPGDPTGLAEEVINCRCVCIYNPVKRSA